MAFGEKRFDHPNIRHLKIPDLSTDGEIIEAETDSATSGFESSFPESPAERLAAIELILNNPKNFIDKGGAASVYRLSNEAACLKLFHPHKDEERRKLGINIIHREAAITQALSNFSRAGVRSPKCFGYYSFNNHDGRSGIILEELDAVTLQHVILGTAAAPSTFEKDRFMDALNVYIEALHEQKNLVHGDLFARNVMIDKTSGLPRIIDFGETVSLRPLTVQAREQKIDQELHNLDALDQALNGA